MVIGYFMSCDVLHVRINKGMLEVICKDRLVVTDVDIVTLTIADRQTGDFLLTLTIDLQKGDVIDSDYVPAMEGKIKIDIE